MPYSRGKEKRLAKLVKWPDLRYDPLTGDTKLFYSADEVPVGWINKKPIIVAPRVGSTLDHDELVTKLNEIGVDIDPRWCNAHMKRILDDRNSAR
jgi:hypothetical protein